MSDDFISAEVECPKCHQTLTFPAGDAPNDTIIKCQSCGIEIGRWGEVKAEVLKRAKRFATNHVRKTFKR